MLKRVRRVRDTDRAGNSWRVRGRYTNTQPSVTTHYHVYSSRSHPRTTTTRQAWTLADTIVHNHTPPRAWISPSYSPRWPSAASGRLPCADAPPANHTPSSHHHSEPSSVGWWEMESTELWQPDSHVSPASELCFMASIRHKSTFESGGRFIYSAR